MPFLVALLSVSVLIFSFGYTLFLDAIKYLGQKYNITIELEHNSKSHTDLFNQLYTMHEFAKDL